MTGQPEQGSLLPSLAPGEQGSTAVLSDDGLYRYRLDRRWGPGPVAVWVMLNPSTADALQDDQTIRRCRYYSTREGCGALTVVNRMAYRATKPADLLTTPHDTVGADNHRHITDALTQPDVGLVVVAWGSWLESLPAERRPANMLVGHMIRGHGHTMHCLGWTANGEPRHPSRLPNDAPLLQWPPCTGLTASWCPRCGDCTCPRRESDGDCRFDTPGCPLHDPSSPHPIEQPGANE